MHDTWFIYNVFLIKNPFLEAILLTSLIKTHFCLIWNQEQKKKKKINAVKQIIGVMAKGYTKYTMDGISS